MLPSLYLMLNKYVEEEGLLPSVLLNHKHIGWRSGKWAIQGPLVEDVV